MKQEVTVTHSYLTVFELNGSWDTPTLVLIKMDEDDLLKIELKPFKAVLCSPV